MLFHLCHFVVLVAQVGYGRCFSIAAVLLAAGALASLCQFRVIANSDSSNELFSVFSACFFQCQQNNPLFVAHWCAEAGTPGHRSFPEISSQWH